MKKEIQRNTKEPFFVNLEYSSVAAACTTMFPAYSWNSNETCEGL